MEELVSRLFKTVLASFPHTPTSGQEEALRRISNFLAKSTSGDTYLLKGYAGTGKTTIVSALVKALPFTGIRTVLMAPTGRAAKVMSGYSGSPAYTIHRKIYRPKQADGNWITWSVIPNTHKNTLFIVDEASMINDEGDQSAAFGASQNVLKDLLTYVSSGINCRLLLIGDLAQLPPVKQLQSPALEIKILTAKYGLRAGHYELTEVVRQKQESGILYNATMLREAIRKGETAFKFDPGFEDFVRLDITDLGDKLTDEYTNSGPEETVVVCRSNKSANNYNKQIRYAGMWFEDEICAGDYVMCVKNNYFWLDSKSEAGFIANGDMMVIQRVIRIEEKFGFRFADLSVQLVDYPLVPSFEVKVILDSLYTEAPALTRNQMNDLYQQVMTSFTDATSKTAKRALLAADPWFQAIQIKFGYAVTCHKAQGGQWKKVFVDQGYLTDEMLDVNYLRWLYTAITRATEKVYLVNFNDFFFDEDYKTP